MKSMTVQELKAKKDEGATLQVIDVRESHEREICSIHGDHIPMGEIMTRTDEIRKDCPVVIHCRSGQRSAAVVNALETNFGFDNLWNLDGGILAWAEKIDQSLETY